MDCDILYKKDGFVIRYVLAEGGPGKRTTRSYIAYCYRIYVPGSSQETMALWCKENGIDAAKAYNDSRGATYKGASINFRSKEDAIAFKLYWT